MDNEQSVPGQKNASYRGTDWSVSVRGSQLRQRVDAQVTQRKRYALAGCTQQAPDGSVGFQASAAQVAAGPPPRRRSSDRGRSCAAPLSSGAWVSHGPGGARR